MRLLAAFAALTPPMCTSVSFRGASSTPPIRHGWNQRTSSAPPGIYLAPNTPRVDGNNEITRSQYRCAGRRRNVLQQHEPAHQPMFLWPAYVLPKQHLLRISTISNVGNGGCQDITRLVQNW